MATLKCSSISKSSVSRSKESSPKSSRGVSSENSATFVRDRLADILTLIIWINSVGMGFMRVAIIDLTVQKLHIRERWLHRMKRAPRRMSPQTAEKNSLVAPCDRRMYQEERSSPGSCHAYSIWTCCAGRIADGHA